MIRHKISKHHAIHPSIGIVIWEAISTYTRINVTLVAQRLKYLPPSTNPHPSASVSVYAANHTRSRQSNFPAGTGSRRHCSMHACRKMGMGWGGDGWMDAEEKLREWQICFVAFVISTLPCLSSSIFLHLLPVFSSFYIFLYISIPFSIFYILLHISISSSIYLHLPSSSSICLHFPPSTANVLHLLPSPSTFLHFFHRFPSYSSFPIFIHLLSSFFIFLHLFPYSSNFFRLFPFLFSSTVL